MVECISSIEKGLSMFLLVATIKSQAMSTFNLTELPQPMLQSMSAMRLLLRKTASMHMSQT